MITAPANDRIDVRGNDLADARRLPIFTKVRPQRSLASRRMPRSICRRSRLRIWPVAAAAPARCSIRGNPIPSKPHHAAAPAAAWGRSDPIARTATSASPARCKMHARLELPSLAQFPGANAQARYSFAIGDISGADLWLQKRSGDRRHGRARQTGHPERGAADGAASRALIWEAPPRFAGSIRHSGCGTTSRPRVARQQPLQQT
jgi:hypothetical protein